MAEEKSKDEKTEQATPRKKEESRKKGQVAKSQELNSIFIIFMGMLGLVIFSSYIYSNLVNAFYFNIDMIGIDITVNKFQEIFMANGSILVKVLAPLLILLTVTGLLINIAQVGVRITPESLSPKFDKLDVIKGFKRMFSTKTLFSLIRDTLKVSLIAYVVYITYKGEMANYIPLADQEIVQILIFAMKIAVKIVLRAAGVLLILAILDYAYQKYDFEKNLRMTKQEIKDEHKQYEGDPLIKMRIRRIQREMAHARMLKDVEEADVVVTNPTHIAVGLKYDAQAMSAPKVIAKGERLMAERIKDIAKKFKIPVVENKPLARALFEAVDIGMYVPARLYKAVAEVLAYVYKLKGKA
ncbi:MAG: flagellar biosynthesis protein FlhB [candidate division Zixibacteria bacterium]|nr:flagellar biosynthesis protein FlhB [candidate division Zixibacteria bacterium]